MSREREMQCLEEFINIYQSEFCLWKFSWECVFLFCNHSLHQILRLFLLFVAISKPTIASVSSSVEAMIIKTTGIRLNVCEDFSLSGHLSSGGLRRQNWQAYLNVCS
jgi:hypothetical protein